MINSMSNADLQVQSVAQPVADSPVVGTFQAQTQWTDDVFALLVVFGY
jgi:hypothetical protein